MTEFKVFSESEKSAAVIVYPKNSKDINPISGDSLKSAKTKDTRLANNLKSNIMRRKMRENSENNQ